MNVIQKAINRLVPNPDFSLNGDKIEWHDERPKPSKAEIDAEIAYLESGDYELEQWRQTAVLTRRKFTLAYKRYPWGEGTLKQAIDSLLQTLLQSEIQAEVQMGEVMQESLAETTEFTRTHEDIIAMATAIGMTPEDVDAFYVFAENEEWRN